MSAESDVLAESGWYEFHTKNALTSVAYVHENGEIFIPDPEFGIEHGNCFHRLVREPRTVTTVEELDALVGDAVVLDRDGDCFQFDGQYWLLAGYGDHFAGHEIALPATVLHEDAA